MSNEDFTTQLAGIIQTGNVTVTVNPPKTMPDHTENKFTFKYNVF